MFMPVIPQVKLVADAVLANPDPTFNPLIFPGSGGASFSSSSAAVPPPGSAAAIRRSVSQLGSAEDIDRLYRLTWWLLRRVPAQVLTRLI